MTHTDTDIDTVVTCVRARESERGDEVSVLKGREMEGGEGRGFMAGMYVTSYMMEVLASCLACGVGLGPTIFSSIESSEYLLLHIIVEV